MSAILRKLVFSPPPPTFVLMTQCMFFVAFPQSLSIPKTRMFDGKSKSIDLCQKKERQKNTSSRKGFISEHKLWK
jgi:hypothetical protein